VTNAPEDERIGCWNMVKKRYEEVEYVAVKITKLVNYELQFYLFDVLSRWHICHCSLSAILRKKIGRPKEEIGNLNGFEYTYLNDLKVPYF
jgi:hypothetical protein